jgi:cysteinyl-tRNA synthetase
MSKSLKNFTTIRSAMEVHTARQIRFCFLLHKYNASMDYSEGSMTQAVNTEKSFVEFFHNVKALLRSTGPVTSSPQHIGAADELLMARLEESKQAVRAALLDDLDTPKAVASLLDLVKAGNKYMESESAATTSTIVLLAVGRYITHLFKVFGLIVGSELGFPLSGDGEGAGGNSMSKEELISPVLDTMAVFRQQIRQAAIAGDMKAVLSLADRLRDDVLPELGIRLEDKGSGAEMTSVWKLEDPEVLRKEKVIKDAAKLAKEQQREEAARKAAERDEKAKISPKVMFLTLTELYSAFDDMGLPTHDKEGQPLAKAAVKKLQKDYAKQQELHDKFLAKTAAKEEEAK